MVAAVLLLLAAVAGVAGLNNGGRRLPTLVVVDDMLCRASHSQFFELLEQQGHSLVFAESGSPNAKLTELGEWRYGGLVVVAQAASHLDSRGIASFVDAGHSIFVAGGRTPNAATRRVAAELGVEFDAVGRTVIDHASFDRADSALDGDHSLIVADTFARSPTMVGADVRPVLYRGAGMRRANGNELVVGALTGAATTYSWSTLEEVDSVPFASGEDLLLVASMQARNGARALVTGSWEMFSNDFFDTDVCKYYAKSPAPSGNQAFANSLTRWVFGSGGTLRVTSMRHELQGGSQQDAYTIRDTVSFGLTIEELDGEKWVPFVRDDVQMEFSMLDPAYRLYMPHVGQGRYNISFRVPDAIGVYKFVFDYRREGYTHLKETMQVDVTPQRHDGFDRFLPVAYPYYVSALSMIAGFFVFSLAFLYSA